MPSEALLGLQRTGRGRVQSPGPVRPAPLTHETRGCPATEAAAPIPEGVPCLQARVTCPAGTRATTPNTRVAARETAGPTPIGATAVARADRPARSPWQSATTAMTHTRPSYPMVDDGRSTCGREANGWRAVGWRARRRIAPLPKRMTRPVCSELQHALILPVGERDLDGIQRTRPAVPRLVRAFGAVGATLPQQHGRVRRRQHGLSHPFCGYLGGSRSVPVQRRAFQR